MPNKNFVVKNGIEVDDTLIFADKGSSKVGINTNVPQGTLDVYGTLYSIFSVVSSASTVNALRINGNVSLGGSIGVANQVMVKTGYGQTWKSPNLTPRTSTVYTAGIGSTSFSVNYTVGLVDPYVNGVKLSPSQFTAIDGNTVLLSDPTFGGETIEFVVYNPVF